MVFHSVICFTYRCVPVHSPSPDPLPATPCTVAYQLLCLWNFPGKNTGMGCHFLLHSYIAIRGLKRRTCNKRCFLTFQNLHNSETSFEHEKKDFVACSGAWQATVLEVEKSWARLNNSVCTHVHSF